MAEVVIAADRYAYQDYPSVLVFRIVNAVIGVIETGFAIRIVLELFGANAASPLVGTIYDVTDRLLGPVAGAFPNFSLGGNFVLDITAILGMILYAALGWIVIELFSFIFNAANVP